MQPDTREAEIAEIMALLNQLSPTKRAWFTDQMVRLRDGLPNAIQGTAPIPDWWPPAKGGSHATA